MNSATILFDCQKCGACCHSPWTGDGYVTLCDIDLDRLRGTGIPITEQLQGYGDPLQVIPKLSTWTDKHRRRVCAAFSGSLGELGSCTIYDKRPEACRRFEVGGALCRAMRSQNGLPV